jgi:hypothetical protein
MKMISGKAFQKCSLPIRGKESKRYFLPIRHPEFISGSIVQRSFDFAQDDSMRKSRRKNISVLIRASVAPSFRPLDRNEVECPACFGQGEIYLKIDFSISLRFSRNDGL